MNFFSAISDFLLLKRVNDPKSGGVYDKRAWGAAYKLLVTGAIGAISFFILILYLATR